MTALICVVGAGYAGRLAAGRLARHGHRVVLIDPSPHRLQRIALHLHAVHGTSVTHPLAPPLQRAGVEVVQDRVMGLDGTTVHLASGGSLRADRVVLTVGSRTRFAPGPGAHTIGNLRGARELHASLEARRGGQWLVVGTGLTGLELAGSLAWARPDLTVHLIGDRLGSDLDPRSRARLGARLEQLGVRCIHETVQAVMPDGVELSGARLSADGVVWCGGMRAASLARDSGLDVDAKGRAFVDASLRAAPGVYVAGDAAHLAGGALRMSCAAAMPQGAHVAAAVAADLRGEDPPPLRFAFAGRCIQLGGPHALLVTTDADDRPRGSVGGLLGGLVKQALYRYVLDVPALELRLGRPVYTWPAPVEA